MTGKQRKRLMNKIYIAGHTIKSLSKEVGIGYVYLTQITSGKKRPSPQLASRISVAINMDACELRSFYCDEVA